MANPLFDGTSPEAARWWREDLLRNDPAALAEVLRTIGGGAMAPLWDRLTTLRMPVTIIAGARDEKFVRWATEDYPARLPQAEVHIVDGAGHGLPREAPRALAALIQDAAG
jgi:2-succinyl-6-hydroxy-2,4-cyclohexadiene-1-carboxylate synthase